MLSVHFFANKIYVYLTAAIPKYSQRPPMCVYLPAAWLEGVEPVPEISPDAAFE